jgi:transposase
VCPARGTAASLVLPRCNTAAMRLHLKEIAQVVEPGAHAVLLLDQAGWHLSEKLDVPDHITLMPLPPKSPELNPVESPWQFMRDNCLSNRIFRSYEDILDHCCHAWNRLADQPWTIMSIGLRDWAHRSDADHQRGTVKAPFGTERLQSYRPVPFLRVPRSVPCSVRLHGKY